MTLSKFLCFISLSLVVSIAAWAQDTHMPPVVSDMTDEAIPVVVIETIDQEEPTCDFAFAPEGQYGITTINKNQVHGRMVIISLGDTIYDSKEYAEDLSGMSIRVRGNTSAYYSNQKPYKIKLEKKADLLNRSDFYKDKDWVLLNDNGITHIVCNKACEIVTGNWQPACQLVNVFINGDYKGLYTLTESIKRNDKCRVDVDETEGYIVEYDAYWWNEDVSVATDVLGVKFQYTFKYPKADDVTDHDITYVRSLLNDVEESIADGTYDQTIDVGSFAAWLLCQDILGMRDAAGTNKYLVQYDSDAKVAMPVSWDFGGAFKMKDAWSAAHTWDNFYFPLLLSSTNDSFTESYISQWNAVSPSFFDDIDSFLAGIATPDFTESYRKSYLATLRWVFPDYPVDIDTDYLALSISQKRQWFDDRRLWMQDAVKRMEESTNVSLSEHEEKSMQIYNLNGQRVTSTLHKGIYVINGRKVCFW